MIFCNFYLKLRSESLTMQHYLQQSSVRTEGLYICTQVYCTGKSLPSQMERENDTSVLLLWHTK